MLVQIFLALAFIPTCRPTLPPPCTNTACTSEEYQKEIKQGFATNWFKTKNPSRTFNEQSIVDVRNAKFRNLRLRCDVQRFNGTYEGKVFDEYLETLVEVVDKCLKVILVSYRVLLKTISGESKNYIPYRLIDKPCIKVIIFFRSVTPGP